MPANKHVTIKAPPGRPCWVSQGDLPLVYLGWGQRDFARSPVNRHYDIGTSFYLVIRGDLMLSEGGREHHIVAPCACIIDRECLSGVTSGQTRNPEILVWVWRDPPRSDALRPPAGGIRQVALQPGALPRIQALHQDCRAEVSRTDAGTGRALAALRTLIEVEIVRAGGAPQNEASRQWELVKTWIGANLSIHAPIPALCDYLRMSPSTLNRFFMRQSGLAPGAYFRTAKKQEALRLIQNEGWTVKATAYHLGYRHATDLSRALAPHQAGRAK
ncbi:MAG: helix-turn-helix domain-containing protein [Verrucomicrobiota bacterium]